MVGIPASILLPALVAFLTVALGTVSLVLLTIAAAALFAVNMRLFVSGYKLRA